MKRPEFAATAPLALALFLAACGSASGLDDLFSQNSGGAGGATAATAGNGGASSATTGGVGGAVSTTSVAATTGSSTTSGPTATGPGSTGPGATGPGSTGPGGPGSSSSGGPGNTVFCNNAPCAAGEICCFNLKQTTDQCGQPGSCGDGYIELQCNGPEDCPGGVCCADVDFQNNPPYKGISCKQSCNNPQNNLVICSDADPTCPNGTQCQNSQVLGTGYKICK
jgi:hypothetical protein